jgi:hypothetical protein
MKYQLHVTSVEGAKRRYAEFSETERVRGDVTITFENGREARDWVIRDANIPLFLSNLAHFLKQVETYGQAVFTAQFSPNSNGQMKEGSLLLSKTSGNKFEFGIYDKTGQHQLRALKEVLASDAERFGIFSTSSITVQ